MNETKIAEIKGIINEITNELTHDTAKDDYESYERKIRAIDCLLHSITLIEKM